VRFSSVFWPSSESRLVFIGPTNLPTRVFYRRVKKRGFLSNLKIRFFIMSNFARKLLISSLMALGLTLEQAQAAVDAGVTTAISNAGADGATIGGAVLAVIVGIAAFKYLRRAL